MSNLLRRLRAAWLFSRTFPDLALPSDYWTNFDAHKYSDFVTSETGVKLRHIWTVRVNQSAQQAIRDRTDSSYMCGVAYGCRGMVAETDSLLQLRPEVSESLQPADQDAVPFRSVNR